MLSSGQELKYWSKSRSWNAVIRTGMKMLKLKQELKIIQFVSPRIHWFRTKDEWWKNDFPDTNGPWIGWGLPMVLSRLLEICERESVKKSECGLSCWLVLPAARKRRETMCALSCWLACPAASQWGSEKRKTGLVYPAQKACVEEGERMLPHLFIVARGSDPGRMAWNILIGRKYDFGTKAVKIFLRQKFFLLQWLTHWIVTSKWVWTPIALLCSLWDKYLWEKYEPLYPLQLWV